MILQRLAEHYDRIASEAELAPPGYSMQKVSFCVVLEPDGRLDSFQDLRRPEGKVLRPRTLQVPGQGKPPGQGLSPCFLWDSPEYLLGFSLDPFKAQRAPRAFAAFREAHLALEASLASPAFSAVCSFLRHWTPEQAQDHLSALTECATNFGVFQIAGERRYVHQAVSRPTLPTSPGAEEPAAICLVSGELSPIARLHEPKIKGVAGAQTAGALVSFNASAFTSHGKDQSRNAPVSIAATFKYTNALNHLLAQRERRTGLGDATVVYWADAANTVTEATLAAFAALLGSPATAEDLPDASAEDQHRIEEARLLLSQLRDGTAVTTLTPNDERTRFFMLGLSPNASRLSVRLWIEADARETRKRLSDHVRDLALHGGHDDQPLPLWRIVCATGRAELDSKGRLKSYDTKGTSPQLAGDLARSVLLGVPYPQSLLSTMVRRIRSDGQISFVRVSAIKAVLVRNSRLRGAPLELPMQLESDFPDVAYRCGRIFALLEKAQTDSLGGDLNSTIKDRYFSAASATPALVFPRLFRLNGHHLAKLEPGTKTFYERQFGTTMAAPFTFPKQLSLEQQGRFIVGYFQQRQDLYTKKDKKPQEANTTA